MRSPRERVTLRVSDLRPIPCICGHDEDEHSKIEFGSMVVHHCRGNTWAYPQDAESDDEGRNVPCQCAGYQPVTKSHLADWPKHDRREFADRVKDD